MGSNSAQAICIAYNFEGEPVACGGSGFPDASSSGLASHLLGLERIVLGISKEKYELLINAVLNVSR